LEIGHREVPLDSDAGKRGPHKTRLQVAMTWPMAPAVVALLEAGRGRGGGFQVRRASFNERRAHAVVAVDTVDGLCASGWKNVL